MERMHRVVFHVDFDYFYAQCEEVRDPMLRGRPVVVCVFSDRGEDSGAVATANYVARRYDVKSGIPIRFAKRRLEGVPDAAFIPVDFDHYSDVSAKAMRMISANADVFEYVGRDEAYLDVTDRTGGDFKKAARLAQRMKNAIRDKLKLTCSVGVTPNKLVSKIASDYKKPDGLTVVEPGRVDAFMEGLKVGDIPGIGKKTEDRFGVMGMKTVGDLRGVDIFRLNKMLGRRGGAFVYNAVRGVDDSPVREREPSMQYGKIMTLKQDSRDLEFMSRVLGDMCVQLHKTVAKNGKMFKSVGIQFFQSDMSSKTRSRTLRNPTDAVGELQRTATALLAEALQGQEIPVRRIGVKVSELSEAEGQSSITSYFG